MAAAKPTPIGAAGAVGAVILWSIGNILIAANTMRPLELVFWRSWLGVAVYLIVMTALGKRLKWSQFRAVGPGSVAYWADLISFYLAVGLTSMAIATTVSALQPIGILFASSLLFGESIRKHHVGWTLVAVLGAILVIVGADTSGRFSWAGNLWSVAAVICWALYFIGSKRARETVGTLEYQTWVLLVTAVLSTPLAFLIDGVSVHHLDASAIKFAVALVLVPGTGHLLMNWAHQHTTLLISSLATLLMPPLGVIGGLIFLDQKVTPLQIVGVCVTVAALAVIIVLDAKARAVISEADMHQ